MWRLQPKKIVPRRHFSMIRLVFPSTSPPRQPCQSVGANFRKILTAIMEAWFHSIAARQETSASMHDMNPSITMRRTATCTVMKPFLPGNAKKMLNDSRGLAVLRSSLGFDLQLAAGEKGDRRLLPPAALRVLRTKGACHLIPGQHPTSTPTTPCHPPSS